MTASARVRVKHDEQQPFPFTTSTEIGIMRNNDKCATILQLTSCSYLQHPHIGGRGTDGPKGTRLVSNNEGQLQVLAHSALACGDAHVLHVLNSIRHQLHGHKFCAAAATANAVPTNEARAHMSTLLEHIGCRPMRICTRTPTICTAQLTRPPPAPRARISPPPPFCGSHPDRFCPSGWLTSRGWHNLSRDEASRETSWQLASTCERL